MLLRVVVLLCMLCASIGGIGGSGIFTTSSTVTGRLQLKGNGVHQPNKNDNKLVGSVISGVLANGLCYKILNRKGRLSQHNKEVSVHLEILAGSADEDDNQRGMAHLLEHVMYHTSNTRQSSSKRQLNPSVRTNAHTDFHHSVYNVDSVCNETANVQSAIAMLAGVLDADQWSDPQSAGALHSLLEKEKAVISSEAAMIHTAGDGRYAVDAQLFGVLHKENVLSQRLPIGGAGQGRAAFSSWSMSDLQTFHKRHYRPSNAVLYVSGDVGGEESVGAVVQAIERELGCLADQSGSLGTGAPDTMKAVSRHFPPVRHVWSVNRSALTGPLGYPEAAVRRSAGHSIRRRLVDDVLHPKGVVSAARKAVNATERRKSLVALSLPTPVVVTGSAASPHYELHLFSKRPIESIRTVEDFRRHLYRRVVQYVLRARLANHQHNITSCFQLSFDEGQNCPREGCAVQTLCVKALDREGLFAGMRTVLQELRRVSGGEFTTWGDVVRYVRMVISEVEEEQQKRKFRASARELGEGLIDSEACGHTYMSPDEAIAQCKSLLHFADEGLANAAAKEMCQHLCAMNITTGVVPHSVVLVAPPVGSGAVAISPDDVQDVLVDSLGRRASEAIQPLPTFPTPRKLYHRKNTVIRLWRMLAPTYEHAPRRKIVPLQLRGGSTSAAASGRVRSLTTSLRSSTEHQLSRTGDDSQTHGGASRGELTERQQRIVEYKAFVQPNYEENVDIEQNRLRKSGLFVNFAATGVEPNRVMVELKIPGGLAKSPRHSPLLMGVGARLMQLGTSAGRRARETIEFFCLERKIAVEVKPAWDTLLIRFSAPAKTIGLERYHRNNGLEMILQLIRGIIQQTDYHYDQQSYDKVVALLGHEFRHPGSRGLAQQCQNAILRRVVGQGAALVGAGSDNEAHLAQATLPRVEALMKQELSRLQRYNPGVGDGAGTDGMELTVAGNMTLGRMREHVVRILGTVISAEQLDALTGINGTVKPSRKVLRKRKQQRLKEEYLLSAGLANASTGTGTSALTATSPLNGAMLATDKMADTTANRMPPPASTTSGRHDRLRVRWTDSSPISISTRTDAAVATKGAVGKSLGYVVGPAFNKRGVLGDGSSVLAASGGRSARYPYLSPTPDTRADARVGLGGKSGPVRLPTAVRRKLGGALSEGEHERLAVYLKRIQVVKLQDSFNGAGGAGGRAAARRARDMRAHPVYLGLMTRLLEEIMNRKLYEHVRGERGLAYDVSFRLQSLDDSVLTPLPDAGRVAGQIPYLAGGWYQIEVMSSPALLSRATQACKHVVKSAVGSGSSHSISSEDVTAAARVVVEGLRKEKSSLSYWVSQLSGSQMSRHYTGMVTADREKLLSSITLADVSAVLKRMQFGRSGKEFTCEARG